MRWTDTDTAYLIDARQRGLSASQIAKQLNTSLARVKNKIKSLERKSTRPPAETLDCLRCGTTFTSYGHRLCEDCVRYCITAGNHLGG